MSGATAALPRPASPLASPPWLVHPTSPVGPDEWRTELAARVDPAEILFAGHYPGFPIFPGVCFIELTRLGAESNVPDGSPARTEVVVSTRFRSPVYPGDELTVSLTWRRSGERWRCGARIASPRGAAAHVVLDLASEPAGAPA